MRKIVVVFLVVCSCLVFVGCNKKDNRLVVGLEAAYAPFNWTETKKTEHSYKISNQAGYVDGYDVVVSKRIAEELNMKLVIIAMEWDGLILSLNSGEIDLVIAGMSPTDERKKEIAFTDEYYRSEVVMVVNKNGNYVNATKLTDFTGAKVVAQRGTIYDDLINQITSVNHKTPLGSYSELAMSVSMNDSHAFVAELPVAESVVASNKSLSIVRFDKDEGFVIADDDVTVAIGLRKTDIELRDKINVVLAGIDTDTRNELMTAAVNRNLGDNTSQNIFSIFTKYFSLFLKGSGITLLLAVIGTIGGFLLALLLVQVKIMKIDKKRDNNIKKGLKITAKGLMTTFTTFFRGTPMIVQAMIFYYGIKLLTNASWWTPLSAGLIIVVINTSAYLVETLRGSVNAIDPGQLEASRSLGFSYSQGLRHIVFPQAIRNSLPALGNEFIVNLKDTAVLSVIGILDLFNATRQVVGATYSTVAPFAIAAIIYLILTGASSLVINRLEKRKKVKVEVVANV